MQTGGHIIFVRDYFSSRFLHFCLLNYKKYQQQLWVHTYLRILFVLAAVRKVKCSRTGCEVFVASVTREPSVVFCLPTSLGIFTCSRVLYFFPLKALGSSLKHFSMQQFDQNNTKYSVKSKKWTTEEPQNKILWCPGIMLVKEKKDAAFLGSWGAAGYFYCEPPTPNHRRLRQDFHFKSAL